MASSDLDQLLGMEFERERAELALKKGGNLQGALDWLEANQNKSMDEIKSATADEEQEPELKPGEEARSLVCDDCGKKLRSQAQAEFHASKSGHENFSESTEEVAPLTEEEKKAKLAELKARAAEKRALQAEQDKVEQKRNEEIRRKSTIESQDAKEQLQRKERIKEAQLKKQQQLEDIEQKKRVQAKIAADKEARRLKSEKEKAERAGQTVLVESAAATTPQSSASAKPTEPKPSARNEARLRLQTEQGTVQKSFPAETTLFEVAHAIAEEKGIEVTSFTSTFPRKSYDTTDFGMTLKEAGLVPNAALIVK